MERDSSAPEIRLRGRSAAEFLDYRGAARTSLFLKHGRNMEFLRRGMTFERPRAYHSVEFARILCLLRDGQGVPHVRYAVTLRRGGQTDPDDEELRTLSLKAFGDLYCTEDASARFACMAPRRLGAFGRALRGGLRRLLPTATQRSAAGGNTPAPRPGRERAIVNSA